jgi:dolichyl-phosphate-mannose-protein mannosyltransferase
MLKIADFFKKNYLIIVFTALAFATRFFYFGKPNEIVFDEVYFGKFAINYFSGENYFDIHPPFGKLLLFFFAKIFGFNFVESQDSQILLADPKNLFVLRIFPALLGILLVPLVFKLTEFLSRSKKAAGIAAFLILFDNAFLTYSRLVLLDIVLVFFGILALYFFFLAINYQKEISPLSDGRSKCKITKKQLLYFILSTLALGVAISIKWTGLSILGIILVTLIWKFFRQKLNTKKFLFNFLAFLTIPTLFYLGTFALHFSLIKKIGQDHAFFSQTYLKNLKGYNGSSDIKSAGFFEKFKELNKIMYTSNRNLHATHPYSSVLWQWPFSQKAIYLWQGKTINNTTANLWLFGNLVAWLATFGVIILTIILLIISKCLTFLSAAKENRHVNFLQNLSQKFPPIIFWLLFAYLANFLPFILIKRVLFLYHYLFAIIFASITLAILLEKILSEHPRYKKLIYLFFALILLFFIFFSPLSFGFPEPTRLYNFQLKIIL